MLDPYQTQEIIVAGSTAGMQSCSPAGEDHYPVRYFCISAPKDKNDSGGDLDKKTRKSSHFSKRQKIAWAAGFGVLCIFFGQLFAGTLGSLFITVSPQASTPKPAYVPPPSAWLTLNHDAITAVDSGTFPFFAMNEAWVIAEIAGCDAVNFTIYNSTDSMGYDVYPGQIFAFPILFDNDSWPGGVPDPLINKMYTLQINPDQAQYYTMLAVLPQVMSAGMTSLNMNEWTNTNFQGAGDVTFLFDGNFSITDFAVQLLLPDGSDPLVLKRNDYAGSQNNPLTFRDAGAQIFGGDFVEMKATLPPGTTTLQMKGKDGVQWCVVYQGDWSGDGISDPIKISQDEQQYGFSIKYQNAYGELQRVGSNTNGFAQQAVNDNLWRDDNYQFYLPPGTGELETQQGLNGTFVFCDVTDGEFANFTSNGIVLPVNGTLSGFTSTRDDPVRVQINGSWVTMPENNLGFSSSTCLGYFAEGWNSIDFREHVYPYTTGAISFRTLYGSIPTISDTVVADPLADTDQDGSPNNFDKEPFASTTWKVGTATRMVAPYTFEDRQDQADMSFTIQIAPPVNDYSTGSTPVTWHAGEGENGAGVTCFIQPVMCLYGKGPETASDYWYRDGADTWQSFWGKSGIDTYSLVGNNANGIPYDPSVGLRMYGSQPGTLVPVDSVAATRASGLTVVPGDQPDAYYTYISADRAANAWSFTINLPADSPLITGGCGAVPITFDFKWIIYEELPYNHTMVPIHVYDFSENIQIQSIVVDYYATAGPDGYRYILGNPQNPAEYTALKAIVENPAFFDDPNAAVQQPAGALPISYSIVKKEKDVGLFQRFNYDPNDVNTFSIGDRIAYWRDQYPLMQGDSEVTYFCAKEKEIPLLTKFQNGVVYDTQADPSQQIGGEVEYGDYYGTYSFNGIQPGMPVSSVSPQWSGNFASIVEHVRNHRKVLLLNTEGGQETAWGTVDAVNPGNQSSVEFFMMPYTSSGTLDVKMADAAGNVGWWLRFAGTQVGYVAKDAQTGSDVFVPFGDVWSDEFFSVSLDYNCTNGTWDVTLQSPGFTFAPCVPFYDSNNVPINLRYLTFSASGGDYAIDAIGLCQAPPDANGHTYALGDNFIRYDTWHFGEREDVVAWTAISALDTGYNPGDPAISGDREIVWQVDYSVNIHEAPMIHLNCMPVSIALTRAADSPSDGFVMMDFVEVQKAVGSVPVRQAGTVLPTHAGTSVFTIAFIPYSKSDVISSDLISEDIVYQIDTGLSLDRTGLSSGSPLVQYAPVGDEQMTRIDNRPWEVDPWAAFYKRRSISFADLIQVKAELLKCAQSMRIQAEQFRQNAELWRAGEQRLGHEVTVDEYYTLGGGPLELNPEGIAEGANLLVTTKYGDTVDLNSGRLVPFDFDGYRDPYGLPIVPVDQMQQGSIPVNYQSISSDMIKVTPVEPSAPGEVPRALVQLKRSWTANDVDVMANQIDSTADLYQSIALQIDDVTGDFLPGANFKGKTNMDFVASSPLYDTLDSSGNYMYSGSTIEERRASFIEAYRDGVLDPNSIAQITHDLSNPLNPDHVLEMVVPEQYVALDANGDPYFACRNPIECTVDIPLNGLTLAWVLAGEQTNKPSDWPLSMRFDELQTVFNGRADPANPYVSIDKIPDNLLSLPLEIYTDEKGQQWVVTRSDYQGLYTRDDTIDPLDKNTLFTASAEKGVSIMEKLEAKVQYETDAELKQIKGATAPGFLESPVQDSHGNPVVWTDTADIARSVKQVIGAEDFSQGIGQEGKTAKGQPWFDRRTKFLKMASVTEEGDQYVDNLCRHYAKHAVDVNGESYVKYTSEVEHEDQVWDARIEGNRVQRLAYKASLAYRFQFIKDLKSCWQNVIKPYFQRKLAAYRIAHPKGRVELSDAQLARFTAILREFFGLSRALKGQGTQRSPEALIRGQGPIPFDLEDANAADAEHGQGGYYKTQFERNSGTGPKNLGPGLGDPYIQAETEANIELDPNVKLQVRGGRSSPTKTGMKQSAFLGAWDGEFSSEDVQMIAELKDYLKHYQTIMGYIDDELVPVSELAPSPGPSEGVTPVEEATLTQEEKDALLGEQSKLQSQIDAGIAQLTAEELDELNNYETCKTEQMELSPPTNALAVANPLPLAIPAKPLVPAVPTGEDLLSGGGVVAAYNFGLGMRLTIIALGYDPKFADRVGNGGGRVVMFGIMANPGTWISLWSMFQGWFGLLKNPQVSLEQGIMFGIGQTLGIAGMIPAVTNTATKLAVFSWVSFAIQTVMGIVAWYQTYQARVDAGWDAAQAFRETWIEVGIPFVVSTAIGLLLVAIATGILEFAGSTGNYIAGIAAVVAFAFAVFYNWYVLSREKTLASALNEIYMEYKKNIDYPYSYELNKALVKHGGFEVGDTVPIDMSVQNLGHRTYHFGVEWLPDDTSDPTEGSAFWFRACYAYGPAGMTLGNLNNQGRWTNWLGCWDDSSILWEDRTCYGWFNVINPDLGRTSDGPHYFSAPITFWTASASATLYSMTQVATEYGDGPGAYPVQTAYGQTMRWNQGVQFSSEPLTGFRIYENSIDGFMANTVAAAPRETLEELLADYNNSVATYRYKDASAAVDSIAGLASPALFLPQTTFENIASRCVPCPGTYSSVDGQGNVVQQSFNADEQQNYYLFQSASVAEWNLFFPPDGQGNSLSGSQQGIRAAAPKWSAVDNAWTFGESFDNKGLDTLGAEGWTYGTRGGGTLSWESNDELFHYDFLSSSNVDDRSASKFALWAMDASGGNSQVNLNYAFTQQNEDGSSSGVSLPIGEADWGWYVNPHADSAYYTNTPKTDGGVAGVNIGLNAPVAARVMLSVDQNNNLICNYQTLCHLTDPIWNGNYVLPTYLRMGVTWDCVAGTCNVWVNGNLVGNAIPLAGTGVPNYIGFGCGVSSGKTGEAKIELDDLEVAEAGGYTAAQRVGYLGTSPNGLILIPKAWFNATRELYDASKDVQSLRDALPITTNIMATWGDVVRFGPHQTGIGNLSFAVDGSDDPVVKWSLTAAPGFTVYPSNGTATLQSLPRLSYAVSADDAAFAGGYALQLTVWLDDAKQTVIYQDSSSFFYSPSYDLTADFPNIPQPIEWNTDMPFAVIHNNGNSPEWAYISTDGVPSSWVYGRGYYNDTDNLAVEYNFAGSTAGFAPSYSSGVGTWNDIRPIVLNASYDTWANTSAWEVGRYSNSSQQNMDSLAFFAAPDLPAFLRAGPGSLTANFFVDAWQGGTINWGSVQGSPFPWETSSQIQPLNVNLYDVPNFGYLPLATGSWSGDSIYNPATVDVQQNPVSSFNSFPGIASHVGWIDHPLAVNYLLGEDYHSYEADFSGTFGQPNEGGYWISVPVSPGQLYCMAPFASSVPSVPPSNLPGLPFTDNSLGTFARFEGPGDANAPYVQWSTPFQKFSSTSAGLWFQSNQTETITASKDVSLTLHDGDTIRVLFQASSRDSYVKFYSGDQVRLIVTLPDRYISGTGWQEASVTVAGDLSVTKVAIEGNVADDIFRVEGIRVQHPVAVIETMPLFSASFDAGTDASQGTLQFEEPFDSSSNPWVWAGPSSATMMDGEDKVGIIGSGNSLFVKDDLLENFAVCSPIYAPVSVQAGDVLSTYFTAWSYGTAVLRFWYEGAIAAEFPLFNGQSVWYDQNWRMTATAPFVFDQIEVAGTLPSYIVTNIASLVMRIYAINVMHPPTLTWWTPTGFTTDRILTSAAAATQETYVDEGNPWANYATTQTLYASGSSPQQVIYLSRAPSPYIMDYANSSVQLVNETPFDGNLIGYDANDFTADRLDWRNQPDISGNTEDWNGTFVSGSAQSFSFESADNNFAIVTDSGSVGFQSPISFSANISKFWQGDGVAYMQSDTSEELGLLSPSFAPLSLTSNDWVDVRFGSTVTGNVFARFYYEGVVQGSCMLETGGNPISDMHWCRVHVPSAMLVDQMEIVADFSGGQYIVISNASIEREFDYQLPTAAVYGYFNETVPLTALQCNTSAVEVEEVGGHRGVLSVPCYSSVNYTFDAPQSAGACEFWVGGAGNFTVNLLGSGTQIAFGAQDSTWWVRDGTSVIQTGVSYLGQWTHVAVTWNVLGDSSVAFRLAVSDGVNVLGSWECSASAAVVGAGLGELNMTFAEGGPFYIDAVACNWQYDSAGNLYALGSNIVDMPKDGNSSLFYIAPGHWREYFLNIPRLPQVPPVEFTLFTSIRGLLGWEDLGSRAQSVVVPPFYDTTFVPTSETQLYPAHLGDSFTYTFSLQNWGNVPQNYTISVDHLLLASPSLSLAGGQSAQAISVVLAPAENVSFALQLLDIQEGANNFTVQAVSNASGFVYSIPASFFINNVPQIVSPAAPITFQQGSTGNTLSATFIDATPLHLPEWHAIYGPVSDTSSITQFWATDTFDYPYQQGTLPGGWSASSSIVGVRDASGVYGGNHAGVLDLCAGDHWAYGLEPSQVMGTSAWRSIGDQATGSVEWWVMGASSSFDVGLFRNDQGSSTPVAVISYIASPSYYTNGYGHYYCGDLQLPDPYDSMGGEWEHLLLDFNTITQQFTVTIEVPEGGNSEFTAVRGPFSFQCATPLVPNEFRACVTGYAPNPMGGYADPEACVDAIGYSFDPLYHMGDDMRLGVLAAGSTPYPSPELFPLGDTQDRSSLSVGLDQLISNPVAGTVNYSFPIVASDGWLSARTSATVTVIYTYPNVVSTSGDIHYTIGSKESHPISWHVTDQYAMDPACGQGTYDPKYQVYELTNATGGTYYSSYSFSDAALGSLPSPSNMVSSWAASDPSRVYVMNGTSAWGATIAGDAMPEHAKALVLDSSGYYGTPAHPSDSATMAFTPMSAGSIEWYAYVEHGLAYGPRMTFADSAGELLTVASDGYQYSVQGPVTIANSYDQWVPISLDGTGWARFLLTFDLYARTFTLTIFIYGCEYTDMWGNTYGEGDSHAISGFFDRSSVTGISSITFVNTPDDNAQHSALYVGDRFGFSTDPLYQAGALGNYAPEATLVQSGAWSNASAAPDIQHFVDGDGLAVGEYDYVLVAQDGVGRDAGARIHVSVWDVPPVVARTYPAADPLSFAAGSFEWPITWQAVSPHSPDLNYSISCDGTEVASGATESGLPIRYDAHELPFGNHVVAVSVTDKWGQVTTDVAHVSVTSAAPVVGCYLTSPNYSSGDYPGTYTFSGADRSAFPAGWLLGFQAADGSLHVDTTGQHYTVLHQVVGGHADVLQVTKYQGEGMVLAEVPLVSGVGRVSSGAVECWLDVDGDAGTAGGLLLIFSATDTNNNVFGTAVALAGINVTVEGGNIFVMNMLSASAAVDIGSCSPGWHHLLVSFAVDGTLDGSTFTVNVDSSAIVRTFQLGAAVTNLAGYGFLMGTLGPDPLAGQGKMLVDGLGLSWDPYYAIGMDEQPCQSLSRADLSSVYPATYEFTSNNVVQLQSVWSAAPWCPSSDFALESNCMGHASVLALCGQPAPNSATMYLNMSGSPQASGTVELWFAIDGDPADSFFSLSLGHWAADSSGNQVPQWNFSTGVANGVFGTDNSGVGNFSNSVAYRTWHHLRLDFALGGQVRVYLDSNNTPAYEGNLGDGSAFDVLGIASGSSFGPGIVTTCVDAIGLSSDPAYTVGENWVPGTVGPAPEATIDAMTPGYRLTWAPFAANILPQFANYTIYCNGVAVESEIPWTSGFLASYDLSGLAPGDYTFTAVFNNGYGVATNNSVVVHVLNVPPAVTAPANASYEVGVQDFPLAWSITDSSYAGTSFNVYVDNVLAPVVPSEWQSGVPVTLNLGDLLPGLHNVTLVAYDGDGGMGSGTCWVNVTNAAPVIAVPANMTYTAGTPGAGLTWAVTDPSVSSPAYSLYRNGTLVQGGAWASGIPFVAGVSGLSPGLYNFTLVVYDGYGACASGTSWVNVTAPPLAINSADLAVGFGSDGQFGVSVTVNPPSGANWTVHVALEDANGLLYSNVSSADASGYATLDLRLKVLFNAAGTTGDGLAGTYYHYRIWVTQEDGSVVAEQEIDNVSIYHWSSWDGWNVSWDAIPLFNGAGYTVYVKAAYWNASSGLCYDSVDSSGNLICTSAFIGQQPVAGEMSLPLPSYGTMSAAGYDASAFMAGYGSGWYYFTYVAPADAANPWAERIGCPALAVC